MVIEKHTTLSFSIRTCGQCGVKFGVPQELIDEAYRNGGHFYCPNGHYRGWDETEAQRLQKLLDAERRRVERHRQNYRDECVARRTVERRLSATRGVVTRTKNRVGNGVCPCCNRTFTKLAHHMKTKHPEYTGEP